MRFCIGVDVGGTTTTVAIGNEAREVVWVSPQFPTRSVEGPAATIASIVENVFAGLEATGATSEISHAGLSTPGPATLDGVLLNSPNLKGEPWNQFAIRAALEIEIRKRFSEATVDYIGDGQSAALGEYSIRTGGVRWDRVSDAKTSDLESLFMVAVGTGLGGGEVQRGCCIRGSQGRAGHAGHMFLPAYAFRYEHDRQLVVGNATSTLESAVSLTGLTYQLEYRLSLEQWRDHPLNCVDGSTRDKAKGLRELAAGGDPLALELFHDQARALGIGLLAANYVGDFDMIVIGGGVCDLAPDVREQYRKLAEEAYHEFALDGFRNTNRFEFSLCGDDASVIGALAFAYDCFEESQS